MTTRRYKLFNLVPDIRGGMKVLHIPTGCSRVITSQEMAVRGACYDPRTQEFPKYVHDEFWAHYERAES